MVIAAFLTSASNHAAFAQAGSPDSVVVNSTADRPDSDLNDLVCSTGQLNSAGQPECTLRAAIKQMNHNAGPGTITFDIPTSDSGYADLATDEWTIAVGSVDGTVLPQVTNAVIIDATTQPSWVDMPVIVIDGQLFGGTQNDGLGLSTGSEGSELRGLSILNFPDDGAWAQVDDITIAQSFFGITANGAVGPNGDGIVLFNGARNATIGGSASDANVVVNSLLTGIKVRNAGSGGVTISHNLIGVTALGAAAGNQTGVEILDNADTLTITDNNISNNTSFGVRVDGSSNVTIASNSITGNTDDNIRVEGGASDITIGGLGAGNTILSSGEDGIDMGSAGVGLVIQGNLIGVDELGIPAGNADQGIEFVGFTNAASVLDNVVAYNGDNGIDIAASVTGPIRITRNSLFANGGIGIDLNADGVTANDVGDADSGPNDLLNTPVILSVDHITGTDYDITLEVDVPAGTYDVELFQNNTPDPTGFGEGQTPLGTDIITVITPGPIQAVVRRAGLPGYHYSATLTDRTLLATSEFGLAVQIPAATTAVVNSTSDAGDLTPGDGFCDTGGVNSEGVTECTLRAAIEEHNAALAIDTVEFAIPVSDPGASAGIWTIEPTSALPTVSGQLSILGDTQPGYTTTPVIAISGSALPPSAPGFVLNGPGALLQALAIHGFPATAIDVAADNATIRDSILGIDPTTGLRSTNLLNISIVDADFALVENSTITNTYTHGVFLNRSTGSQVLNNQFIDNDSGVRARQNVLDTTVAGNTFVRGNYGVVVEDSLVANQVEITSNSIYDQTNIGIDLGNDGPNPNDAGDVDPGANDRLNTPILTVTLQDPVNTTLQVDLEPDVLGSYLVEVFRSTTAAGGASEAEVFVRQLNVTMTQLPQTFGLTFPSGIGDYTATLTRTTAGQPRVTSEISPVATTISPNQIAPVPDQASNENESISLQVSATPGGASPLTYGAAGLPDGLSIDTTTGLISGTLTYVSAGTWPVSVTVTSADAPLVTTSFIWSVANENRPPTLDPIPDQANNEDDFASWIPTAADPDGDPLTWTAIGLPPGVSIDTTTGEISGTISYSSAPSYTPTITVTDGTNPMGDTFLWTINNVNRPPVMDAIPNLINAVDDVVAMQALATDPDGDALSWIASGLPDGLIANPTTGLIFGRPTTAGTAFVLFLVLDANGGVSTRVFSWEITAPPPPTTTTTAPPTTTTTAPPTTTTTTTTTTTAPTTTTAAPATTATPTTTAAPTTSTTTSSSVPTTTVSPTTTANPTTTDRPAIVAPTTRPPTTTDQPTPPVLPFTDIQAMNDHRGASLDQITVAVLDNDTYGNAPRITSVTEPTIGTAQIVDNEIRVTLPPSFAGTVTFDYAITDDSGVESTATVTISSVNVLAPTSDLFNNSIEEPQSIQNIFSQAKTLFSGLVRIRLSSVQLSVLALAPLLFGILRVFLVRREYLVSVTNTPRNLPRVVGVDGGSFTLRHDALLWATRKPRIRFGGTTTTPVELPNGSVSLIDSNLIQDTGH